MVTVNSTAEAAKRERTLYSISVTFVTAEHLFTQNIWKCLRKQWNREDNWTVYSRADELRGLVISTEDGQPGTDWRAQGL